MKDDEVYGVEGTSYTAEYWQYDSRLGRRWNIDPVTTKYPMLSPYSCFKNNPIFYIDYYGLEAEGGGGPQGKESTENSQMSTNNPVQPLMPTDVSLNYPTGEEMTSRIRRSFMETFIPNFENAKSELVNLTNDKESQKKWNDLLMSFTVGIEDAGSPDDPITYQVRAYSITTRRRNPLVFIAPEENISEEDKVYGSFVSEDAGNVSYVSQASLNQASPRFFNPNNIGLDYNKATQQSDGIIRFTTYDGTTFESVIAFEIVTLQ